MGHDFVSFLCDCNCCCGPTRCTETAWATLVPSHDEGRSAASRHSPMSESPALDYLIRSGRAEYWPDESNLSGSSNASEPEGVYPVDGAAFSRASTSLHRSRHSWRSSMGS